MLLVDNQPRLSWKSRMMEFDFNFYQVDENIPYWCEDRHYRFTLAQIDEIDKATEIVHELCLKAVEYVMDNDLLELFQIPESAHRFVKSSWNNKEQYLYGRMDFSWNGIHPPKLLEYNADTPTSLFECSVIQWDWLKQHVDRGDLPNNADQFNLVDELLIARFRLIKEDKNLRSNLLHFAACTESEEDLRTIEYLADCAIDAGFDVHIMDIEAIELSYEHTFLDDQGRRIVNMFKLYPWEFMLREEFGAYLEEAGVMWLEPAWKSILSNKALLPILWKLFPDCPYLLPAYFDTDQEARLMESKVKKPIFSREGSNIEIWKNGIQLEKSDGPYGEEGFIVQEYSPLANLGCGSTVIGSWLIGKVAGGMSVRESSTLITEDTALFVPHIIHG